MIKINYKKYIKDRMWFGWWYNTSKWNGDYGWIRYDKFHWTILYRFDKKLHKEHKAREDIETEEFEEW